MKPAMKTAIVLFNLGGPDRAESVRPFLFNLFNDRAIIGLPTLLRTPLAYWIAKRRAPVAAKIYDHLGGGSPLLKNTEDQAAALQAELTDLGDVKVFTCMRYWHPMAFEVVQQVADYNPDRVLLLPLYPQYSTTTTASSVAIWKKAANAAGLTAPTQTVCCYPDLAEFVTAQASLIREQLVEASKFGTPRILFSAHGLPKKIITAGDPYQWQCEQTAAALVAQLSDLNFESVSCYQSKVGRLEWIGPATEDEIKRAGTTQTPLVVVPIAFTSEHSETLVELDIEYREVAQHAGVPFYGRAPAVGTHSLFIAGLAKLARATLQQEKKICSASGSRICPHQFGKCPQQANAA